MKYLWIFVAVIWYLIMMIFTYMTLPEKLQSFERYPYRIYQNDMYYGVLEGSWVSESLATFYSIKDDDSITFNFLSTQTKVKVESNLIQIFHHDILIGSCNKVYDCEDLNPNDSYTLEDISVYAKVSKLYLPDDPVIFTDTTPPRFMLIQSLTYALGAGFIYFGFMGHHKIEDFLRWSSKYFERIHWLSDVDNARWRVYSVKYLSLILGILIHGYLIYVMIQIHLL